MIIVQVLIISVLVLKNNAKEKEINEIKNENEKLIIGKENRFTCIAFECVNCDKIADCILRFEDCFMKKTTNVTGIDPSVVVHRIPLLPGATPVKQELRRMRPEWALKVKNEIAEKLEANFIEPIAYPKWLTNIVPAPKKDGKVRMCVDYWDLNEACPKDDFPLPPYRLIDRSNGGA